MTSHGDLNFGEYLRTNRTACGLTVEAVCKQTKINRNFLEAMEGDNWAKLPGRIFVQSYLRSYAACLGIPADDLLRRFAQCTAGFYEAQEHLSKLAELQRRKNEPTSGFSRLIERVGAFLRPRPTSAASRPSTRLVIG